MSTSGPSRLPRRSALRAAAVAASGLALEACASGGRGGAAAAAPTPTAQPLTVPFQLWVPAVPVNKTSVALIQQFFDANFNAKHRGIRATWQGSQGAESTVVTQILAGAASTPWVVASCCSDWPIIRPFLAPLDPLFKSDNVDVTTTWQGGQLARFQDANGTTYGLPEDAACDAYLYRQDILDQLGLPYPDPTWTSGEAASLWATCTGKTSSGAWRYGVSAPFMPGCTAGLPTVVAGFGGAFQDATRTLCQINSPQGIAAGEYWMSMVQDKIATGSCGSPAAQTFSGLCVFATGAEPTIIDAVEQLGTRAKWDFLPWPRFPARAVGNLHDNFYGMLKSAPQAEVAWSLLKFLAIEPAWQRFYMQLALAPPALATLLEEWYAIMRATAPILKGKQLQYWGNATLAGQGVYDFEFFRYEATQANAAVTQWFNAAWNGTSSVTVAWNQMAKQVNALEASGAAMAGRAAANAKNFPATGSAVANVGVGI
jgi:ABC-type glycerol-3-phosphate transport system substrate-binding protein